MKVYNKYALGQNIDRLLRKKKMTQRDFAKAIGLHESMMVFYKYGRAVPSVYRVYKMAQVLGVTIDELVEGMESDESDVPIDVSDI